VQQTNLIPPSGTHGTTTVSAYLWASQPVRSDRQMYLACTETNVWGWWDPGVWGKDTYR